MQSKFMGLNLSKDLMLNKSQLEFTDQTQPIEKHLEGDHKMFDLDHEYEDDATTSFLTQLKKNLIGLQNQYSEELK